MLTVVTFDTLETLITDNKLKYFCKLFLKTVNRYTLQTSKNK